MDEKGTDDRDYEDFKQGAKGVDDEEIGDYSADSAPAPEMISLQEGYNQTYIIRTSETNIHEVLFRCGNWCYSGLVDLGNPEIGLKELQVVIPALQKQQGSLQYLCEWRNIPRSSFYADPVETLYECIDTIGKELVSKKVEDAVHEASNVFSWIDDDDSKNYFELQTTGFDCFDGIDIIASKTFVRELILIVIYYKRSFFVVLQSAEGSQPLLDVRFPDLSEHLQGIQLRLYNHENLKKLLLWQCVEGASAPLRPRAVKVDCKDVSGVGYNQTFLIRRARPDSGNNLREVLFRFGNWCYNGHVDLGPRLELADIPIVIPMLRRQQSALTFMCETSKMPSTSLFTKPMEHFKDIIPALQRELAQAEDILMDLSEQGALGENDGGVHSWLDDDNIDCFFELGTDPSIPLSEVEAIACKVYLGTVVLVIIYYDQSFYVVVQDGRNEQPLLDTQFPNICCQNSGFQMNTYRRGVEGFPELRRLSLWRVGPETAGNERIHNLKLQQHIDNESKTAESKTESREPDTLEKTSTLDERELAGGKTREDGGSSPTKSKVALPHHIAPMKGAPDLKNRLRDLGQTAPLGRAPWDATGKPLGASLRK